MPLWRHLGNQKPEGGLDQVARPRGTCHPCSPPSHWPSGADSLTGLSLHAPTRVCPHPAKPRAPSRVLGLARGPPKQNKAPSEVLPAPDQTQLGPENPWPEPSHGFGPWCWALAHTRRGAANPTTRLGGSSLWLRPGPCWSKPQPTTKGRGTS